MECMPQTHGAHSQQEPKWCTYNLWCPETEFSSGVSLLHSLRNDCMPPFIHRATPAIPLHLPTRYNIVPVMKQLSILLFALCLTHNALALDVVATLPYLGSLAREVGGEKANVTVLAPATADPHYVDGRPSYLTSLRRADVLIHNGLELEVGWLPPLVDGARNGEILPGQMGNINASQFAGPLLQVGLTDRRMGDVHPGGNPHFQWDPRRITNVAIAIYKRFATLDPTNADFYKANAARFKGRMTATFKRLRPRMAAMKGQKLISFHNSMPYYADWLGAQVIGNIEPVPGIPPTPKDIARAILLIRKRGVKYLIAESWYNPEAVRVIEEKTNVTVLRVPGDVGSGGTQTYFDLMERLLPPAP